MPPRVGERVRREDIERMKSVTRAIEHRLGQRVTRAVQTVEAKIASARVARQLLIADRSVVLRMVRTYFASNGHPLHLAIVHGHPQLYRYSIELLAR